MGVRWSLSQERPNAQLVESRYWHERVRERTASRWQAIEAMGDNPDEVDEEIAWDQIRQSQEYMTLLKQRLFEKVNRGDILKRTLAQQMAQSGMVPGVGGTMPPGANGAPPGAGGDAHGPGPALRARPRERRRPWATGSRRTWGT